jgi:hypothetical protein
MAGGGTGAFGGPGGAEKARTSFPTWGTGSMGTTPGGGKPVVKPPVTFNFNGGNNPFGAGFILPSETVQGYEWKVNSEQQYAFAISLIGDKTGRYIPSKYAGEGAVAGSPVSRDEAISKVITDLVGTPGSILKLKEQLNDKQMYANQKAGNQSVATGDDLDSYFYSALATALDAATAFNAKIAAQQGNVSNPKIYSFEQFMLEAPKTGSYDTTSFGYGGTSITRQKFKPEDFDIAIDQLFQQTVGRGATEDELNDFVKKLQAYESKNPQKTVTTGSQQNSVTTQSGGVSTDIVQSMMRKEALANPEAEKYNKATKYLTYFMEALDNPIELG